MIDFLITSLIVVVTPGIGVLFTLSAAITRGSRAAVVASIGCTLGIVPHALAAIVGLAAVLQTSAVAFQTLKIPGSRIPPLPRLQDPSRAWRTYRGPGF